MASPGDPREFHLTRDRELVEEVLRGVERVDHLPRLARHGPYHTRLMVRKPLDPVVRLRWRQ